MIFIIRVYCGCGMFLDAPVRNFRQLVYNKLSSCPHCADTVLVYNNNAILCMFNNLLIGVRSSIRLPLPLRHDSIEMKSKFPRNHIIVFIDVNFSYEFLNRRFNRTQS